MEKIKHTRHFRERCGLGQTALHIKPSLGREGLMSGYTRCCGMRKIGHQLISKFHPLRFPKPGVACFKWADVDAECGE